MTVGRHLFLGGPQIVFNGNGGAGQNIINHDDLLAPV
jgi:hypothetical protein